MTQTQGLKNPSPVDLPDVLDALKNDIFSTLNCHNIGIIQEFDAATQTATIQVALKQVLEVKPDGTRILQEVTVLGVCPVITLYGGNAFLSMPIQPGDACLVLFNDREIDEWHSAGGVQTPVSYRQHDLSDAIAIVGIRSLQNTIADYIANGVRLSYSETSRITLSEDLIETIAAQFNHVGNMNIQGNLTLSGTVDGDGGGGEVHFTVPVRATQLKADDGATGTFSTVTVVDGIVTGGS